MILNSGRTIWILMQLLPLTQGQLPDQFHISLSGIQNEMVIEFVTHKDENAYCMYSTNPSTLIAPSTPIPPVDSNFSGYFFGSGYLIDGYDLYADNMTIVDAIAWCNANSSCAGMTFNNNDQTCNGLLCYVYFKTGLQYAPSSSWTTLYKPPPPIPNVTASIKIEYMNSTEGPVGWLQTVVLTNLEVNTQYYYTCGAGANDWSPLKWFTNEQTERPWVFAIFADFGYVNDESVNSLYADVEANAFDVVILAGDQAYDLDSNNGETGNDFMRMQEGYASFKPLFPAPGNHEARFNYSHYINRYAGLAANAGYNSGSGTALYYSIDIGLAHFLFFSTEAYWSQTGIIDSQLNWLKNDLIKANANRENIPWLVAIGHKAWNMDNNGECGGASCTNATWYDSLFHDYGVDLYFVGHQHEYRRWISTYGTKGLVDLSSASPDYSVYTDPKYLVSITSGAVGCPEVQPAACGGATPSNPADPTATCSRNYGYGLLSFQNSTHAFWTWKTSVPHAGSPDPFYKDIFQLIVHNHGPRPPVD